MDLPGSGSETRSRRRFRDLDAFQKVKDESQERTASGGAVTTILLGIILAALLSELLFFESSQLTYNYSVDAGATGFLQINLDISVAVPCEGLSLVARSGHTLVDVRNAVKLEPTSFSVSQSEAIPTALQAEAISNLIKQARRNRARAKASGPLAGCRVSGSIRTTRADGEIFIAPAGHGAGHGTAHLDHSKMNMTHRIDRLSFGENFPTIVNPLDETTQVTTEQFYMFQYFVSVVPTVYVDKRGNVLYTNQFAVTEHQRTVDHAKGSHGSPGITFKYEIESIMVTIQEDRNAYLHLITRVCGVVGGVFVTAGILHRFVRFVTDMITGKLH